jgi:hypothetical protein
MDQQKKKATHAKKIFKFEKICGMAIIDLIQSKESHPSTGVRVQVAARHEWKHQRQCPTIAITTSLQVYMKLVMISCIFASVAMTSRLDTSPLRLVPGGCVNLLCHCGPLLQKNWDT